MKTRMFVKTCLMSAIGLLPVFANAADGKWCVTARSFGYGGLNWSTTGYWVGGVKAGDGGRFIYDGFAKDGSVNWVVAGFNLDVENVEISGIEIPNVPSFVFQGSYPLKFVGDTVYLNPKDADGKLQQKISFIGNENVFVKTGRPDLEISAGARYEGFSNIIMKHGIVRSLETDGVAVTAGNIHLEGNEIHFKPGTDSDSAADVTLAQNGNIALKGAVRATLEKGGNTSASVTLGNITRTADYPGTLYLVPKSGVLGESEKFFLANASALVHAGSGIVSPFMTFAALDTSNANAYFLKYDTAKGLVKADDLYVDGFAGANENSIVRISSPTTLDADKTIFSLVIEEGGSLTIPAGVTLTIGDGTTPAGVILQNASAGKTVIGGAGAVDFRGSEGIFWQQCKDPAKVQNIEIEIKGSAGITLTGRGIGSNLAVTHLRNATYSNTGAIRIYGERVQLSDSLNLANNQSVYVFGDRRRGAHLWNYTTISELHLAGFGAHTGSGLHAQNTTHGIGVFTGLGDAPSKKIANIILDDDAAIRPSSSLTFDAPISGSGGIYMVQNNANNTLTLNATNTYAGKTLTRVAPIVLNDGGTFGKGEVINDALITLNKNSEFVISNAVSGTGSWIGSTGKLVFANPSVDIASLKTQGDIEITGNETAFGELDMLSGKTVSPSSENTANPAMVAIGNDEELLFNGCLEDGNGAAIGLRKTGNGELTIKKTQNYTGPTIIEGGAVKIFKNSGEPYSEDILYHLDAQKASSMTIDAESGEVTAWKDVDREVTFAKYSSNGLPVYTTDSDKCLNGKGALYFDKNDVDCLECNKAFMPQTVVIMFMSTDSMNMGCLWARARGDHSSLVMRTGGTSIDTIGNAEFLYSHKDDTSINGVTNKNGYTKNEPTLVSASRDIAKYTSASSPANNVIGWNYTGGGQSPRAFNGAIGEVIAFNRVLSHEELMVVENYVWNKWKEETLHEDASEVNFNGGLPNGTALTMHAGSVLDLNGIDQTIASIDAEDAMIVNTSGTPATLTVTGENNFRGVIGDGVKVVSKGAANVGIVSDGATLKFEGGVTAEAFNAEPPKGGMLYWLDAADASTVQLSENGYVTNWISKAGIDGMAFGLWKPAWSESEWQPPKYTGTINGLGAIEFGASTVNYLVASQNAQVQTLVMVFKTPTDVNQVGNAGIWGDYSGVEPGIKFGNTSFIHADVGNLFTGADAWCNEVYVSPEDTRINFTRGETTVVHVEGAGPTRNQKNSVGGYLYKDASDTRIYRGMIGEVITYSRKLTAGERDQLEAYLKKKWRMPGYSVNTKVFSDDVQLELGVTLDANGTNSHVVQIGAGMDLSKFVITLDGTPNRKNFKVKIADLGEGVTGLPSWPDAPSGWEVKRIGNSLYLYSDAGTLLIIR